MDKNAIKRYAIWARRELISRVSQKALQYGIDEKGYGNENADSINGILLSNSEKKERQALISRIKEKGYDQVIEEVAYVWFNRFSALRYMEVNQYLPTRVRVFTDENNHFKPQILNEAIHIEMKGLDKKKVFYMKEQNHTDELFKYLLIVQCNALNEILPKMFQEIDDYTELLFPDNLLREGSVLEQMVSLIPEEDWKETVQIIGWLYQYYNTEPKDVVFNRPSGTRIKKEDMPAATQLFTPEWIVKYLVENSLGYLWKSGHNEFQQMDTWKYFVEDAIDDEADGEEQKFYRKMEPNSIKCLDPCCGSGHILAYVFDVLMDIYNGYGYSSHEAVSSIVSNNIFGLDIDERASQLSYFVIMMKARQYDKRFFTRGIQPHVCEILESNGINNYIVDYFSSNRQDIRKNITQLIHEFHDAKEYGSLIKVTTQDWNILTERMAEIKNDISIYKDETIKKIEPLIEVGRILSSEYEVVITNPPYLKADSLTPKVANFIMNYHENAKYDIYAAFIYRCHEFLSRYGHMAMITMHNFMFAPSFLEMRDEIKIWNWINMLHLGSRAFSEISGEVVQTVAYIVSKINLDRKLYVVDVTDIKNAEEKELYYLENKEKGYKFDLNEIEAIPGHAFGYALSSRVFELYKNNQILDKFGTSKAGVVTGADNLFVRFWYEVKYEEIEFSPQKNQLYKYVLFSKGGTFNRWYGNAQNVLKLADMWDDTKTNKSVRRGDRDFYYRRGIGWSQMGGGINKSYSEEVDCICKTTTPMFYPDDPSKYEYILGYLNSGIAPVILKSLNPTLSILTSDILNLPFLYNDEVSKRVTQLVEECYYFSKEEYSQLEENWEFKKLDIVKYGKLKDHIDSYIDKIRIQHEISAKNMNELHEIFLKVLDLHENDKNENLFKCEEIMTSDELVKRVISYGIGCVFGRYSLDKEGIVNFGGELEQSYYASYVPDEDNIVPILSQEYFNDDDVVNRLVEFIGTAFGEENIQENLSYIAQALGGKGQPREIIRNYLINGFYPYHVKMYQKCPIYWLFDSGKKSGFKCLVYIHRYKPDILARIRTDYVHEQQARYRTELEDFEHRISENTISNTEKVKITKNINLVKEQITEINSFEEKLHHLADKMLSLNMDAGVSVNYENFKDVLAKL